MHSPHDTYNIRSYGNSTRMIYSAGGGGAVLSSGNGTAAAVTATGLAATVTIRIEKWTQDVYTGMNQKVFDPNKHWATSQRGVCVEKFGTLMDESFDTVPAQAALRSSPRMVRPISKPILSDKDMWPLWYDVRNKGGMQYALYRFRDHIPRDKNNCMKSPHCHLFN